MMPPRALESSGRHTPPGSSVAYVELSDNKGWVVESAKDQKVLEKSSDGRFMVENITGMYAYMCKLYSAFVSIFLENAGTNSCKNIHAFGNLPQMSSGTFSKPMHRGFGKCIATANRFVGRRVGDITIHPTPFSI